MDGGDICKAHTGQRTSRRRAGLETRQQANKARGDNPSDVGKGSRRPCASGRPGAAEPGASSAALAVGGRERSHEGTSLPGRDRTLARGVSTRHSQTREREVVGHLRNDTFVHPTTSDAFLAFFSDKWKLAFTKIQQKPTFPNIHGSFVHSGQKRGPPGVPSGGRWADRGPCRCRAPLGVGEGHAAEHTPTADTREEASLRGEPLCGSLREGWQCRCAARLGPWAARGRRGQRGGPHDGPFCP